MELYADFRQLPRRQGPSAVVIGSFDGLHLGHQALCERALAARRQGLQAGVLTFEPHPARVLAPRYAPALLMSPECKRRALHSLGFDWLLQQRFDREFAALDAGEFAERVLARACRARLVVVGYDFSFGRERAGDPRLLEQLGQAHGFSLLVVDRVEVAGIPVSSTRIRSFLLQGRAAAAALLLGRPYVIEGEVVAGDGRGRQLGYPTLNLASDAEIIPGRGVYACFWWPAGQPAGLPAVVNVGTRPTFSGRGVRIEVHLPGRRLEDQRGSRGRLGFIERLRDEQRFAAVEQLVAQIGQDAARALEVCAGAERWRELSPLGGFQT